MSGQTMGTVGAWLLVILAGAALTSYLIAQAVHSNRAKQAAADEQTARDFDEHVESALVIVEHDSLAGWVVSLLHEAREDMARRAAHEAASIDDEWRRAAKEWTA